VHVLTRVEPEAVERLVARDEFFWLDLLDPADEELDRVGALLQLHPLALEDTKEFSQKNSSRATSRSTASGSTRVNTCTAAGPYPSVRRSRQGRG
jgi:hypothetical protein